MYQGSSCLVNQRKYVNGKEEQPEWDESSKTLLLSFENDPAGVNVSIEW